MNYKGPPPSSWGAGVGQKRLSLFQKFKYNFCASSSNTVEKYSLQELESRPRFSLRSLSLPLLAATFPPGKRWQGRESLPGTILMSVVWALLLTRFPVSLQLVPPALLARIPGRVGAAPRDLTGSSCQPQQGAQGESWNPGSALDCDLGWKAWPQFLQQKVTDTCTLVSGCWRLNTEDRCTRRAQSI